MLPDCTSAQDTVPAETVDATTQLAEGDRLFGEATQLQRNSQFQQAFDKFLEALEVYQSLEVRANALQEGRQGEARTLTRLGLMSSNLGQYEQALNYYRQALTVSRELGDRLNEGIVLSNTALVYDDQGRYTEALDYYEQALTILREIGDRASEGTILNNMGRVHSNLGDASQALNYYQQALSISRETGNREDQGSYLSNIGAIHSDLGNYSQALDYYQQSLSIRQEVGDRLGQGITLNNIGLIYGELGNYPEALDYYQQALAIHTEIGYRAGEGTLLGNIGMVYTNLGDYPQALNYYQQSLAISLEMGDRAGQGITLSNIGLIYDYQANYPQALNYYQQALVISREIGNRTGEGITLNNIASVYRNLGDSSKALDYYQQALAIHTEIGKRPGEGTILNNIGLVYTDLANYQQALTYFERALTIIREIGDHSGESNTINNIGTLYYHLGDYPQSLNHYQQALAISQEIGDRDREGIILNNIGLVYDNLNNDSQALDYYQQSLAIRTELGNRNGESTTLNNIGAIYRKQKNYPQALDYYQRALAISQEIGDRPGEGSTLNNIGSVYSDMRNYSQALHYYQQALTIHTEIGDRASEGLTFSNIGYLFDAMGKPELAIVFLKQSINRRESIRSDIRELSTELQQSFTDSISHTYRKLADLLLQADRVLEAQRVLDLLRVQELDEYLQTVERGAQTGSGVELLEPETQIRNRQHAITNQAVAIGEELAQLRQVETRTPEQMQRITELEAMQADVIAQFEDFIYSDNVQALIDQLSHEARQQDLITELNELVTLQDNLRALEQNTVLLYPLILDDRIEMVLVTPNAPPARYSINISRTELNQAVVEFRQTLESPRSNPKAIAHQLYQWLIQPMASDLEAIGAETILYAPDGVLRYVPLAALHDGEQWLVERFRINHITAASLTNLNLVPAVQPHILAAAFREGSYAFQVGERQLTFSGLPFAGREVENLASAFPDTTQLLDAAFNPTATLPIMDDHTIVHLATHAEFIQGSPNDSFILFGNGDRITLEEIKQWQGRFRNVDLIVLSACETGVGETLGNGEEILGFGYLMQQAGARAAIASLWSVNDGGTQVLMDAFYTALNNGYSKAEALQQAQIALITRNTTVLEGQRGADVTITDLRTGWPLSQSHDLAHPYYWAPFILIGNGL
ncbi:tetratricopeptide repeat protein [Leptolyngbya sp. FACHB-16]|nr:tetratricopeptide repeat protein [Leptolyngbya sp. FACHB-16]